MTKNVNVATKRLPTIFLFGEEYTTRDRDELLRAILKSQFYRPDLIIINLQEFISKDLLILGIKVLSILLLMEKD